MPESKPISVRIPQNLLEQVDAIALLHYPPRKRGAAPNRSQTILDFITQGVELARQTAYDNSEKPNQTNPSAKGQEVTYNSPGSQQTAYDSTDNRQLISVYDRVIIEEVVQQQLSHLGIANEITFLRQEITELKNLVADRPSQSQPPEPASEQQADRTPPEQPYPASAETQAQQEFQPQSVAPEQSERDRPSPIDESDRTPPEQPHSTTAETQAQSILQPESAAPEQSDRDQLNDDRDRPDTVLQQTVFEFENCQIRFVGRWDDPWWVAQDVCQALEIAKTDRAVSRLDSDEKGAHTVSTPGGPQKMTCINESGLYSLVLTSQKPEAKRFKKWLTFQVIPAIRKTGNYSVQQKPQHQQLWWDRLVLFQKYTTIPDGFWSIYMELHSSLIQTLEAKGFVFPERACPDISVGKCWCSYLRSQGIDPDGFPDYEHHYPDQRSVVMANIYPDELLPMFRRWLRATYIPEQFPSYVHQVCTPEECNMVAMAIGYDMKPVQKKLSDKPAPDYSDFIV